MLSYLIYFSKSSGLLSEESLQQILRESREWNVEHGITGMLVYVEGKFLTGDQNNAETILEGRFIQVLEGNEADVQEIYEKIRADRRHTGLVVLKKGIMSDRSFTDWAMGFKQINHPDEVEGYINLNDWNPPLQNDNTTLNFLKSFYQAVNSKL